MTTTTVESTRVPTAEQIGEALERVRATHRAYNAHLRVCDDAERGDWTGCRELVGLEKDADAASYQYGRLKSLMPAMRGSAA